MTYNKPDVLVLGDATRVIQGIHNKSAQQISDAPILNPPMQTSAAYDLDD